MYYTRFFLIADCSLKFLFLIFIKNIFKLIAVYRKVMKVNALRKYYASVLFRDMSH